MPGFIKIYTEITEHWIWRDAERLKWWLDLMIMTADVEKKQLVGKQLITLQRGQLVASLGYLSKRWKRSRKMVESFLMMLEAEQMITKSVGHNVSIITISNYDKYQANDEIHLGKHLNANESVEYKERGGHLGKHLGAYLGGHLGKHLNDGISSSYEDEGDTLGNTFGDTLAKKEKDIKEKKYISTSTSLSGAREKELYDKLKESEIWIEQVAMKFRVPIERIVSEIDDFALDCDCRGKEHNRLNDTKQHFCDWLRLKIERENNVTDKSKSENKRRGTEVTATSWQDYEGAF